MSTKVSGTGSRFSSKKEDEEETAKVYQEFIETFASEPKPASQSWVRGGVVNPDAKKSTDAESKVYKPKSRFGPISKPKGEQKKLEPQKTVKPVILKKKDEKKKSNLEIFKEELKRMQEQREQRNKMSQNEKILDLQRSDAPDEAEMEHLSTNIFVGNLHNNTNEKDLLDVFGRYGALSSVKIMTPRPDDKHYVKNCGFVAYMNKFDSERAINKLRGKELNGNELKLGWGKPVPVPPFPIYIPDSLFEMMKPPQSSGLPFNAHPKSWLESEYKSLVERVRLVEIGIEKEIPPPPPRIPYDVRKLSKQELAEILKESVVKVTIPIDRAMLVLIHRTIEFVVLEGPEFESAIIHREQNNPCYRFLYDYHCPEHVYYRWKLWSILHGESACSWSTEEFRMYESGPWWRPPKINFFACPIPEELIIHDRLNYSPNFKTSDPLYTLYDAERDRIAALNQMNTVLTDDRKRRLKKLLTNIEPTVNGIGKVMQWCLVHAESAEDIVNILENSMDPDGFDEKLVPLPILVGRIYLTSDILYNSCAKVPNATAYRKILERHLPSMFSFLNKHYCILIDESQAIKLKGEQLKQKVLLCLRAWNDWAIYTNDYLNDLRDTFLGIPKKSEEKIKLEDQSPVVEMKAAEKNKKASSSLVQYDEDDEEGDDEDVDGKPLDSPLLLSSKRDDSDDDDADGVPLDEDITKPVGVKIGFNPLAPEPVNNTPAQNTSSLFIKSKWETLDEETIESETINPSKRLELFSGKNPDRSNRKSLGNINGVGSKNTLQDEDVDGEPLVSSGFGFNLVAYDDDDVSSPEDNHDGRLVSNKSNYRPENKIDREKLREIELRVMKYQDELELAKRQNRSSHISQDSINEQVKKYRDRLIESVTDEELMGAKSPSSSLTLKRSRPSSRNRSNPSVITSDRKSRRRDDASDCSSSEDSKNRKRRREPSSSSSRNGRSSRHRSSRR